MNSKLTLFWGLLIFLISGILFSLSDNSFISFFYVFISMLCGVFLIVFRKDIPVFSPVFMLISSIFINIGFPALYLLLDKTPFSEELLKNISITYLIYFFALIFPLFFANQMFVPSNTQKEKVKSLFSINFKSANINFYLLISNLLLILFIFFLLKSSDFSFAEALKHPLNFRFAASAGNLAYIRKLVFFLFMINTFLLSKYNFENKEWIASSSPIGTSRNDENHKYSYKKESPLKLKVFTVFHIIFLFAFAAISGSRSFIFLPVISSIGVYVFYNRLKIKTFFIFSIIFLLTLGLISFYSIYRNNSVVSFDFKEIKIENTIAESVKRLDNFKNSFYFFEYIEKENNTIFYFKDFHILEQVKNHVLQPFSRNLIPEKGYYFSSLMTEKVFNTDINDVKITYNFGGISNAFWNFGLAGVILEGLFLGIAVVWLHKKFLKYINHDSFFLFFMMTFFFIPNSIIVDGFWNTMDGCGYFLNLLALGIVLWILGFKKT